MKKLNPLNSDKFNLHLSNLFKQFLLSACITALAACGGGGGNSDDLPVSVALNVNVSGLAQSGLPQDAVVLQNNGAHDLTVMQDGIHRFDLMLQSGANYAVEVSKQPQNRTCRVLNGSGTATSVVPVTIPVVCLSEKEEHIIGGFVHGLTTGPLIIQNNDADLLTINEEGPYAFPTPIANNESYKVSLVANPPEQLCTISNSIGTNVTADVDNVDITCSAISDTFTIGGTVTGLTGDGLVIQNNGEENLPISPDGPLVAFVFKVSVAAKGSYQVTIASQPSMQHCRVVENASGTNVTADVDNVRITCSPLTESFTIGGTVTNLTGGELVIQNNGNDTLKIHSSGKFVFDKSVERGGSYNVTKISQPDDQECTVSGGSGSSVIADVDTISIVCSPITKTYHIGGTVHDLGSGKQLKLLNNGNEDDLLTISQNGKFKFDTPLASGSTYVVTVKEQPIGQTCTVNPASGPVNKDVTDIDVTCSDLSYTISGELTGLLPDNQIILQNNHANDLPRSVNGKFTFTTPVAYGRNYDVTIKAFPALQDCEVIDGTGENVVKNIDTVKVSCKPLPVTVLYSFPPDLSTYPPAVMRYFPVGLMQGQDKNFYGISTARDVPYEGYNDETGYIFKMTPGGAVTRVHTFEGSGGMARRNTPALPTGLMQAGDGTFYGTTFLGGKNYVGSIYKFKDSGPVEEVYPFGVAFEGPVGGVILGTNNDIYGAGYGAVALANKQWGGFVLKRTSAGQASAVVDFGPFHEPGDKDGLLPNGKVLMVKIGQDNYLYGTTERGGTNGRGTIFRVKTDQSNFSVVHTFEGGGPAFPANPGIGPNNAVSDPYTTPYSGLIQATDGHLYGVARYGGTNNVGRIFRLTLQGNFTTMHHFTTSNSSGYYPITQLTQLSDGNFYGITAQGGAHDKGTIFRMTPAGVVTTIHSFSGGAGDGATPSTQLISDGNGNLYGATSSGGVNDRGVVFKMGRK